MKDNEHDTVDTAIYSPLGDEDKTAKDYKARALQALAVQSSFTALKVQLRDNARQPHDLKAAADTTPQAVQSADAQSQADTAYRGREKHLETVLTELNPQQDFSSEPILHLDSSQQSHLDS